MINLLSNWQKCSRLFLVLTLSLAVHASAQQRGGGAGGGAGGFGGFGGFGGGNFGGGNRGTTGTTGSTSATATYPDNGTIGDAYFTIDPETRRVVYIADPATAKYLKEVLQNLDRPKPQVLIKVVFVEVTHNKASDIGVEGGWAKGIGNDSTGKATQGFGLSQLSNPLSTNLSPAPFSQPLNQFAPVSPMTAYGAGLYQILGQDYQVTLRAIAQAGNAKVLSRPSILARNNQPATITVGQSVPLITSTRYDTFGNAINSVTYTDVGVILKVTPFITADGLVEMIISPEISSIDQTLSIPISAGVTAPVIDIRSADTVAVTADGQTVIIGGLMENDKSNTDTKIPFIGDLPLLGALFKRSQKSDTKTELLIFLTPHVVQTTSELAALSDREKAKSDAVKGLPEAEVNKFLDTLPTKQPAAGATSHPSNK
jgi:general secretion pathway protein D